MTTTIPVTSDVSFVQAAALLATHLTEHALPEPVSLSVTTGYGDSTLTAQLRSTTLPDIAAELITWANTLTAVTAQAWRPPKRDQVHLSIQGTLTGSVGAVGLKVFGSVDYDPRSFPGLEPHPWQGVSLSPGQLRTWAANPPTTTDIPVLDVPRTDR